MSSCRDLPAVHYNPAVCADYYGSVARVSLQVCGVLAGSEQTADGDRDWGGGRLSQRSDEEVVVT